MEPIKINLTYLKSIGACEEGLDDFRRAFPRGLTVKPGARLTPRTAERLLSLTGHFSWFVGYLPAEMELDYDMDVNSALAEYHQAKSQTDYARRTYERARVRAFWRALGGVA